MDKTNVLGVVALLISVNIKQIACPVRKSFFVNGVKIDTSDDNLL